MKANKIFVFSPSAGWQHCGGATIICANSLEEAIAVGNREYREQEERHRNNDYSRSVLSERGEFTQDGNGIRIWVLDRSFTLAEPEEVGVLFSDANYA